MSSRGPRTPQQPQKLYYTVGELARMADVSDYRMRNLLRANEVPVGKSGQNARRGVVYVSSLYQALPELAESIRFKTGGDDK